MNPNSMRPGTNICINQGLWTKTKVQLTAVEWMDVGALESFILYANPKLQLQLVCYRKCITIRFNIQYNPALK